MSMKQAQINDLFDYDYKIFQNPEFFKFSLDSVLLAEFIEIHMGQKEILDLCSGNAPIPMILNKKFSNKINITGVEIQEEIYNLGVSSIQYNNISNVFLINDDVCNLLNIYKNKKFDIISCNPPYFKVNETNYINDNMIKAIARHEIKVDIDSIIEISSKLLKNQGYLYLVHRPERLADIINSLKKYKFGLKRMVPVYSKNDAKATLILIEAIYNGKDYVIIDKPVLLDGLTSYKNIFRK